MRELRVQLERAEHTDFGRISSEAVEECSRMLGMQEEEIVHMALLGFYHELRARQQMYTPPATMADDPLLMGDPLDEVPVSRPRPPGRSDARKADSRPDNVIDLDDYR